LFSPFVESMIREDIKRFKSIIETGEIPEVEETPQISDAKRAKVKKGGRKSDPSISPS
jgi:hypothetical protein